MSEEIAKEPEKTAAIIVNWNGGQHTQHCLAHLPGLGFDFFVLVDNGSEDGSDQALAQFTAREQAELIRNGENRGFARAANQGMQRALELGADFVFLLNNDAKMDAQTLPELLAAAHRHPHAGLFAGKILDGSGERIWCAGVDLGFHHNLQRMRGFGKRDRGQWDREEVVDAVTGCGLLIRRELLLEVGFFDEDLFVYVEDVDLSIRARDMGWEALYVPSAVMTHEASSASGGGYNAWRKYMVAYNLVQVVKKRNKMRLWLALFLVELLGWPLLLFTAILRGRTRSALWKGRGLLHALFGSAARPPKVQRNG